MIMVSDIYQGLKCNIASILWSSAFANTVLGVTSSMHLSIHSVIFHQSIQLLQCWRQWQDSVEENKEARVALSFFVNITLRKAFNQWLVWTQNRQECGTKLQLAVHVRPLPLLCKQLLCC